MPRALTRTKNFSELHLAMRDVCIAQPDCRTLNPAYEANKMLNARNVYAIIFAAQILFVNGIAARAQDNPAVYRDVETKYIFGFTEGSGIGLEGEKEFSIDTVARIG